MAGWELENVEDAARGSRSFFIAPLEERSAQSVGDEVRLHFLPTQGGPGLPRAERMWVDIVEKHGSPPRFVGALASQPARIADLGAGDRVSFGPEHIAQTVIKRSDPRWFEAAEKEALVSLQVFEEGAAVLWMYREAATHEEDSGWRLFTSHETPEYLDDQANTARQNVAWLIDFDPTLLPAIRADVGAAFERTSPADPWIEVKNWDPARE